MSIFNFFKKQAPSIPPVTASSSWQETSFNAAETFREPLSPLSGLMPPPSLERPNSLSHADTQTILAKLDVLAARLEQVNIRLEKMEQSLRVNQPPQAPAYTQQPSYKVLRRW